MQKEEKEKLKKEIRLEIEREEARKRAAEEERKRREAADERARQQKKVTEIQLFGSTSMKQTKSRIGKR